MQQTRFCGEISLIMLSHHQNNTFSLEQPCDVVRSRPIGLQKKIRQHPLDKSCLSMQFFPLFIYIFVGWDALAKARRGKEKN